MLLGVIADDFTGAGDIANTLAKGLPGEGGLLVSQYAGVPDRPADPEVEAGVIALKTRSVPATEAVSHSLEALSWLQLQGCRQIVFKYCSTFDSTPRGNIGPVAEALADALGAKAVLACPAAPAVGRTVHQGHLFVHDRLLNESGMQNHPLTPMVDPDLRRWLAAQSAGPIGLLPAGVVRAGTDAVRDALAASAARGETLIVADAAVDADLITLGRACIDAPLITGAAGIALSLPSNFLRQMQRKGKPPSIEHFSGPEAILAGSCSGATRLQIEEHALHHPVLKISVNDVIKGDIDAADVTEFLQANQGRGPLAYSSADPSEVAAAQDRFGRMAVAEKLDALFADVARLLVDGGLRRLVVAGGETSGAVVQALGSSELRVGPEINPGVPILVCKKHNIGLALKSGNFGSPTFFADALSALEGGAS
jgi:uncharacterized protein YgbK (DUF1537 family)